MQTILLNQNEGVVTGINILDNGYKVVEVFDKTRQKFINVVIEFFEMYLNIGDTVDILYNSISQKTDGKLVSFIDCKILPVMLREQTCSR